jgi:transposase
VWRPPAEPSAAELAVIKAVRRAKLFVFLRLHRHELFDEQFQAELAQAYVDSPKGQPPVPPARLALATVLQAYTGVSDDEVIEATVMDRRWQLVLDCMDAGEPPFSKGTLVGFRKRLIEKNLDRRLVERTVELAARTGGFGARALRAALDSSPLWGAGRVEDTFNLMGHALRKALGVIAVLQGRGQAAGTSAVAEQAGVPQLAASSLKAALDADWDDPAARDAALAQVLGLLDQVETFIAAAADMDTARACLQVARQVRDQDVDLAGPAPALRRGVAKDRRISVEDAEMRHGRKSRSVLFDGYKRHVVRDLDTGLVPAVGITAASAPEASVTGDIAADLDAAGRTLAELHIDRAYLSSALVRGRRPDLAIFCKAWRVRNTGGRFAKDQFTLDFAAGQLTCPAGVAMPFEPGKTVRFP